MDWLWVVGGILVGRYLYQRYPFWFQTESSPRTVWSVKKSYKQNLKMIGSLPLSAEERQAACEAARQKMLRDLDDLMS